MISARNLFALRKITLDHGMICAKEWALRNLSQAEYLEALEEIVFTAELAEAIG